MNTNGSLGLISFCFWLLNSKTRIFSYCFVITFTLKLYFPISWKVDTNCSSSNYNKTGIFLFRLRFRLHSGSTDPQYFPVIRVWSFTFTSRSSYAFFTNPTFSRIIKIFMIFFSNNNRFIKLFQWLWNNIHFLLSNQKIINSIFTKVSFIRFTTSLINTY